MKNKRNIIYTLGVVVVLVLVGLYFQNNGGELEIKFDENGDLVYPDKRLGENLSNYQERVVAYQDKYVKYLEEFNKQDIYGGNTPEETLELYIKALEARDFELASKYFVLRDQEKEFGELKELTSDELLGYLSVLKLEIKSTYFEIFDEYELGVYDEEGYLIIARLVKNKETDIWKLESL